MPEISVEDAKCACAALIVMSAHALRGKEIREAGVAIAVLQRIRNSHPDIDEPSIAGMTDTLVEIFEREMGLEMFERGTGLEMVAPLKPEPPPA